MTEWWETNDEPGTFRLDIGVLETGITEEMYLEMERLIADAKPASRHLIGLTITQDIKGDVYTGAAHCLGELLAEAHLWAMDRPMTPTLIKDMIAGINAKLREMKTAGLIIDGTCWYDAEANTVETLKAGKLFIDYDYTPVPPLEDLTLRQRITDQYLATFATAINS